MEEYGIEKLKEVSLVFVETAIKLEDAFDPESPKGKKFSLLQEGIPIFVVLLPKAIGFAGDMEEIKNEFHNLSPAEVSEINAYVAEKLDLDNDLVEALVEAVFTWGTATYDLVLAVKDILNKD